MTTMDDLLYAWLAEADDSRFERAFNAYFAVAFPALTRHLARTAPCDPGVLEEIAQDALLKFFERIGRDRRLAAETVVRALGELHPLPLGPLHVRRVGTWRIDVGDYQSTAMRFRPQLSGERKDSAWKDALHELAEQIPPLQSRGWQLLDHVRVHLRWESTTESAETVPAAADAADVALGVADVREGDGLAAAVPATADLADAVLQATAAALSTEADLPGTNRFVRSVATVIDALPRLRVPTNGYLFEIAMSLYLDNYRRRGRQKRGGLVAAQAWADEFAEGVAADGNGACKDTLTQWEEAEFFERFHAYLRAPVVAAEEAYEAAALRGRAPALRRKRDALAQKLARTLAVMTAIGEGYSQEETARRLDLSRNQVKYVLELLQDACARFAAEGSRVPAQRSSGGVATHAD